MQTHKKCIDIPGELPSSSQISVKMTNGHAEAPHGLDVKHQQLISLASAIDDIVSLPVLFWVRKYFILNRRDILKYRQLALVSDIKCRQTSG